MLDVSFLSAALGLAGEGGRKDVVEGFKSGRAESIFLDLRIRGIVAANPQRQEFASRIYTSAASSTLFQYCC